MSDFVNHLLQFDFEVIYKPGISNIEADCLFRNPVLETNEDVLEDKICPVNFSYLEKIRNDQDQFFIVDLKNNIRKLKDNRDIIKNNVIYRKIRSKYKIHISEHLGKELIKDTHEKFGHIGSTHTLNISRHYYFPNMLSLIKNISLSFAVCLRNKSRVQTDKGSLGHLGPPKEPFEIMSLDTIEGLGGRRSTKKYLHLLVDHFTRFAYILTSSSQNIEEFIKLITKVKMNINRNASYASIWRTLF